MTQPAETAEETYRVYAGHAELLNSIEEMTRHNASPSVQATTTPQPLDANHAGENNAHTFFLAPFPLLKSSQLCCFFLVIMSISRKRFLLL